LVFLSRHFNHLSIFIRLVQIFNTSNLRNLALSYNGIADGLEPLELNFQKAFDHVIRLNWGYFNCDFHLSFLSLSDLEPNLFEILKPLIASDRKYVLVQIVELWILAFGDYPEHEWVIADVVFEDVIFQFDNNVNFFDGTREECCFSKGYVFSIDINEIFCFAQFCSLLLFLRRFAVLFLWALWLLLWALWLLHWCSLFLLPLGNFQILNEFNYIFSRYVRTCV